MHSEDKASQQRLSEEIDCLRLELGASRKSEEAWRERFIRLRARTQSGGGEVTEKKASSEGKKEEMVPKGAADGFVCADTTAEGYEALVLKVFRDVFGGGLLVFSFLAFWIKIVFFLVFSCIFFLLLWFCVF